MRTKKDLTVLRPRRALFLLLLLALGPSPSAAGSPLPDDMIVIPAGEFLMGSPAGTDGLPDEQPQRAIYLGSYLIDRHEVSNEAYLAFVTATKHRIPENSNPSATLWSDQGPMPGIERHPVVNV